MFTSMIQRKKMKSFKLVIFVVVKKCDNRIILGLLCCWWFLLCISNKSFHKTVLINCQELHHSLKTGITVIQTSHCSRFSFNLCVSLHEFSDFVGLNAFLLILVRLVKQFDFVTRYHTPTKRRRTVQQKAEFKRFVDYSCISRARITVHTF